MASDLRTHAVDAGFAVEAFSAADEAFLSLVDSRYDVFVIVQAPGEADGNMANLLSLMMTSERLASQEVPIIAITDDGSTGNVQSLYASGAQKVIVGRDSKRIIEVLSIVAKNTSEIPVLQAVVTPLTVCLFDDSYAYGQHVKAHLEARGHRVEYFPSAEAARAAALKKHYDLIVAGQSDAAGLEVSGFVLAVRNSGDNHCRTVPIFALSDQLSDGLESTFVAAGASSVFSKRDQHNAFNAKITQAVDGLSGMAPPRKRVRANTTTSTAVVPTAPRPDLDLTFGGVEAQPGGPVKSGKRPSFDPLDSVTKDAPPARAPAAPTGARPGKRQPWGLIIAVFLSTFVAVSYAAWHHFFNKVEVTVVSARHGALSKSVNGSGRVVAKKQVDLTSAQPGLIAKVMVSEGDEVTKSEILAQLDEREALVNVSRAQARLEELTADIQIKQRALEQLRETVKNGSISSSMIDELAGGITAARAKRNVAEQELAVARVGIERLKVTAPFGGVIMQSYAIEGGWSEPPGALFKLVDLGQLEVAMRIDAAEVRDVSVGQTVQFTSDAFPGKDWGGSVVRLVPGDEQAGKSGIAYASMADNAPKVRYGQAVDGRILTVSSKDAIKVPYEAVFERSGQSMVAVLADERVVFKPVDLGIRALAEVQVLAGLSAGDEVVLVDAELQDGQRVHAQRLQSTGEQDAADFPYREKYRDVAIYTTDDLRRRYDEVMIVDVRSKLEFDVVHVTKAVNVPLSDDAFESMLAVVRGKESKQPLVFYCNGHTCTKSYKAAQKAANAGFKNVYAYDSGIFDWMGASRDKTTLLNSTPAPLDKMVSEDYFQSRLIDFEAFKKRAKGKNAIVVDVRDELQKKTSLTLPTLELPMNELIVKIAGGEYKNKQLLIADAVGKQVQWLQYVLEDLGFKDYYFLRGGVDGVSG